MRRATPVPGDVQIPAHPAVSAEREELAIAKALMRAAQTWPDQRLPDATIDAVLRRRSPAVGCSIKVSGDVDGYRWWCTCGQRSAGSAESLDAAEDAALRHVERAVCA